MGKISDLLLGIGIDTKELEKGLKSVDKMFGDLEKSMSKVGLGVNTKKPIDDQIKSNKELQAKIKELEKSNKAIDKERLKALKAQQKETAKLTKLQEQQRKKSSKSFKLGPAKARTVRGINSLEKEGADVSDLRSQLGDVKDQQGLLDFKKKLTQEHKDFVKFKDAESKDNLRTVKQEIKTKQEAFGQRKKEQTKLFKEEIDHLSKTGKGSGKAKDTLFADQMIKEQNQQDELEKRKKSRDEKDRTRSNNKRKRRAANHQLKLKQVATEQQAAQKSLQERLRGFKQDKQGHLDTQKMIHQAYKMNDKFDSDLAKKRQKRNDALLKAQERIDAATRKRQQAEAKRLQGLQRRAEAYIDTIENSASFRKIGNQQKSHIRGKFGNASEQFVKTGSARHFKQLNAEIREFNGRMSKLNVIQSGLTDSTRNMIRSYASMFALFQGTTAIEKVGMEFQGMRAAMLASSGSEKAAAESFTFIDNLVNEMGLNLKDTTDSYVKFQFAAKGKISNDQMQGLFTSLAQFGVTLKSTPEQMKLAQKAIVQMLSKGTITAEELKQQLGDSMPGAVQVFARALNIGDTELFKLMEQGKLLSSEVLPKVSAELKKSAEAGGAFEKAKLGLQVTKGRFITNAQRSGDKIFSSGFEKGLSKLYKTLSEELKESGKTLEDTGNIYNKIFKGITVGIKAVTPLLKATIQIISKMADILEFSSKGWSMITEGLGKISPMLPKIAAGVGLIGLAMKSVVGKVMLGIGAFQELISLFDDKLVGKFEVQMGKQFNFATGMTSGLTADKDGNFFAAKGKGTPMTDQMKLGGGMTAGVAGAVALGVALKSLTSVVALAIAPFKMILKAAGLGVPDLPKNSKPSKIKGIARTAAAATGQVAGAALSKGKKALPYLAKGAGRVGSGLLSAPFQALTFSNDAGVKDEMGAWGRGELGTKENLESLRLRNEMVRANNMRMEKERLQREFQVQYPMVTPNQGQVSKEIILSGLEITVNAGNIDPLNAHQVGKGVQEGFLDNLNAEIASVISGR